MDSDVKREIVVTRSDRSGGAQILVFDESGREIAASPSIGRGYRWRNLLGAAPFGPAGGLELVDVLTPHLTGVVQFYALLEPDLKINASIEGFTSHVIGTRNLDMALAGDFDGDNRIEVLLPDQSRRMLASIRRTADGAGLAWRVPLGGVLTTNLAAVALPGGELVVGAGREDSVLRVWMP